jgi:hypothetical protein
MEINIEKLMTISNYALLKKLSRQHVYRLIANNELTVIHIDGISFVLMDEKALGFERKRL